MNKNFITVFMLDGEYHSTQTKQLSSDWCIVGATYIIDEKMYKVTMVHSQWINEMNHIKVSFLNSKPV